MTQVSRIDGQVMREINAYLPLLPGKSKLSMFKSVTKKCQTWKLDNEVLMMHEQKTAKNDITLQTFLGRLRGGLGDMPVWG